jgi:hypothetical protein
MGCCNRRRAAATMVDHRSPEVATVANTRCAPGWTRVHLKRDYGAPRPFWGPVTGIRYGFGGRRRVGCVHDDDLVTGDHRRPGILQLNDAMGTLFARV